MFGIINPLSYLIGTIILIITPGPNSMFCLSVAAQQGARKAYHAICGVLLGDSVLILLTVLGAGTALKLYPALFHAMKLAGGLYLAYIGFGLLRGAVRKWFAPPPVVAAGLPPTPPPAAQPHQPQSHPVFAVVFRSVRRSRLSAPRPLLPAAGTGDANRQLQLPHPARFRRTPPRQPVPPPPPRSHRLHRRHRPALYRLRRKPVAGRNRVLVYGFR